MKLFSILAKSILIVAGIGLMACKESAVSSAVSPAADAHLAAFWQQDLAGLDLADNTDFELARRGLIAAPDQLKILSTDSDGKSVVVWDMTKYEFLNEATSPTAHPSLWRQARLNNIHGLFEVTPGIYQVRGFDLSNMSIIDSDTGYIVVDPLTTYATAKAAMEFALTKLPQKPVRAVLFTHSHVDHFGGVLGMLQAAGADPSEVAVYAPEGFLAEASSENILAGEAMLRRAEYMYGKNLPRTATGHIDTGLGKTPAFGRVDILKPTVDITPDNLTATIDGVEFEFQLVSGSEAPAEFTFYLPKYKAFCGAELTSRNLHNIYTLRGAKVRDALQWSKFLDEAMQLFSQSEIYFASHHWPLWGQAEIQTFLANQRDAYKYIHDQTLRLANRGYNAEEIAEQLVLPKKLRTSFATRGYYGSVRHNSKAVYQHYFGWYDGNPSNLDPLPPQQSARKYLEYMGGIDNVLQQANKSMEAGEYRWVAQVLKHAVFAEPKNKQAKALLAKAYEKLGYRAESGPWRDVYLAGAQELRQGEPDVGYNMAGAMGLLKQAPLPKFFEAMAARLRGPKAEGLKMKINFEFTDLHQKYLLVLENSVLHMRAGQSDPDADATVRLTQDFYLKMATNQVGIKDMVFSKELDLQGSRLALLKFLRLFDKPDGVFPIVTP